MTHTHTHTSSIYSGNSKRLWRAKRPSLVFHIPRPKPHKPTHVHYMCIQICTCDIYIHLTHYPFNACSFNLFSMCYLRPLLSASNPVRTLIRKPLHKISAPHGPRPQIAKILRVPKDWHKLLVQSTPAKRLGKKQLHLGSLEGCLLALHVTRRHEDDDTT